MDSQTLNEQLAENWSANISDAIDAMGLGYCGGSEIYENRENFEVTVESRDGITTTVYVSKNEKLNSLEGAEEAIAEELLKDFTNPEETLAEWLWLHESEINREEVTTEMIENAAKFFKEVAEKFK